MKSGTLFGIGLTFFATGLSLAGFQSHAWGVVEGALTGMGLCTVVNQSKDQS